MPSLIDQFNKNIVGSNSFISDYLPVISSSGDFKRITDLSVIIMSWNNILLTPLRSYTHDPDYGSNLYKLAFEPADQGTIEAIKNEIYYRLEKYDNRAFINDVKITFTRDRKGFIVDINFTFNKEKSSMKLNIDGNVYLKFME